MNLIIIFPLLATIKSFIIIYDFNKIFGTSLRFLDYKETLHNIT